MYSVQEKITMVRKNLPTINKDMTEPELFAIDLDNTIVFTKGCHNEAFYSALRTAIPGRDFNTELEEAISTRQKLDILGVDQGFYLLVKEYKDLAFRRLYTKFLFDPMLPDYMISLQRIAPVVIVTNCTHYIAKEIIQLIGLDGVVPLISPVNRMIPTKPNPFLYQHAMQQYGVTVPMNCIVFEDSEPGILAAESAGCNVEKITYGDMMLFLHNMHKDVN